MVTALIIWAATTTLVAIWAIFQFSLERASSRMADQFRENDRQFYRQWEDIWFKQLEQMADQKIATTKPARPRKGKKTKIR